MSLLSDNARILLSQESHPGELLAATHALRDEFAKITGISERAAGGDGSTVLSCGVAISPADAARCIVDFSRTTNFLRGVRDAITDARVRFPDERIRVLYAGSGPWAPLALPLCTHFSPGEVGFTLLDIHEESLAGARQLVEHFGLGEFVDGFVRADATTIRLDLRPHVIVAETMQAALAKEPQLALMANLAGQLEEGGIFVPERILVHATAVDVRAETEFAPNESGIGVVTPERHEIAVLMDLTPASAGPLLASARGGRLPASNCEVPELPPGREFQVMLRTKVDVCGSWRLGDYDSGLTYPVVLGDLGTVDGGDRLEFSYRLGRRPEFEVVRHIPPRIRPIEPGDNLSVLALNLESEHFLSPMNGRRLEELLDFGGCHRVLEVDGQVVAFIIALESGATYDSQNYQWFNRDRSEFVYVDRVVVSAQHRGRGYASALYDEVFGFAREQVRREVVCEFNLDPPNPASQAFHASYGFAEVGTREAGDRILSMQSATLRQR